MTRLPLGWDSVSGTTTVSTEPKIILSTVLRRDRPSMYTAPHLPLESLGTYVWHRLHDLYECIAMYIFDNLLDA